MQQKRPYVLEDGVQKNAENPLTFYLPPAAERENVPVGHHVKLIFTDTYSPGVKSERMWVKVTGPLVDGKYQGYIDNDPVVVDAQYMDTVVFEPRHIINVLAPEEA